MPSSRAVDRLDQIRLRGLKVFAHHGVLDFEAGEGQVFVIDVTIHADLHAAGVSDDLEQTIDYGELAVAIHNQVKGERHQLIERVAERVAEVVLEHPRVEAVDVEVHKPQAPISVPFDDVVVVIHRHR